MKFTIATIATLAATAAAMASRDTVECCAEVQAKAYLGDKCSGLALLDFTTPVDGSCYNFHNSTEVAEGEDPIRYYTQATCENGIYTANIWVGDECTAGKGVYPLEQGLECSSDEVTDGMSAALQITCV